jgi:pilus assembly protein Flp/PilA
MSTAVTAQGRGSVRKTSLGLCGVAGDHRGVTALEYGLIAAVLGALVVTAVTSLGNSLDAAYMSIGTLIATTAAGM